MILGFHYHIPAYQRNGVIYTSGFLGVFLDSMAMQVHELICFMHTPLPSEDFMMDYALKSKNIKLVSMGIHASVPRRLLTAKQTIRAILPSLKQLDILLIRCPTPLLPALSGVRGLKKTFLIVGDYQKSSQDLRQSFFRKKGIQLWATLNKWQQDRVVKNSLVFVNNGLIYQELKVFVKNLHLIKTTTLQRADFFFREDTCQSERINLLYTGRLDLSKGLQEMIESLAVIRSKGIEASLHFVGWEEKSETTVTDLLLEKAAQLNLAEYVLFHGKKQIGTELNSFYRMADIFIIGSKVNEGFPRTIWEAFANSVPVIASSVGSIPFFLRDTVDVLLIKPGSIDEMTKAILRLIDDRELRKLLIRNAYHVAESNTLDKQTEIMTKTIADYLISPEDE
ncbi:MAG: glycosyltransferase [Cyclobacteriaceae bacterium]|nr:MAG: glycosyltransferase [Cyclobacteriaceae bacterium]